MTPSRRDVRRPAFAGLPVMVAVAAAACGLPAPARAAAAADPPGHTANGVHIPSSVLRDLHPDAAEHPAAHGGAAHARHAPRPAAAPHHRREGHAAPRPRAPAPPAVAATPAPSSATTSRDPRVGGAAELHTRGLDQAAAAGAARPYLQADPQRDVAADRAFVAQHAADFHAHAARDLPPGELQSWQAGAWRNEWHYGRRGWWWEAGGAWYPYPAPVWPYPEEVSVPSVDAGPVLDGPDLTAQETAAAPVPPLPSVPAGAYVCQSPVGTYPAVRKCETAWTLTQGTPTQAGPQPGGQ